MGDSMLFWSQDYMDDISTKVALVQQIAEMSAKLCTKCKLPQEVCSCQYLLSHVDFYHFTHPNSSSAHLTLKLAVLWSRSR